MDVGDERRILEVLGMCSFVVPEWQGIDEHTGLGHDVEGDSGYLHGGILESV